MVKLLPIYSSDIDRIIEIYNDEFIHTQSVLGYFKPANDLNLRGHIEQWLQDPHQKHYRILDENTYVGVCQIFDINSINRKCKLGIMIEKEFHSQGIGKKVLKELIKISFHHLNLHKIEVEIVAYNERSIRLFTSMGFVQEGALRKSVYKNGQYHSIYLYGLLKEEYDLSPLYARS